MITVKIPRTLAGPKLADGTDNSAMFTLVQQALVLKETTPGVTVGKDATHLIIQGIPGPEDLSLPVFETLIAVPGAIVEGYPIYAEVPDAMLEWDIVEVVANVLPIAVWEGEGEDRTNVGTTRKYREMPGYIQRDGKHYIALTYPLSGVAESGGGRFFDAGDVAAVKSDLTKEGRTGKLVLTSDIPPAPDPNP